MIQLLFLSKTVTVYDPDTDQVPQKNKEKGASRATTPDGFYLLELKAETGLKLHPFTLLDALYQYDLTATHQLLSEVRVDLTTQIEEEALRFRNGRMQDMGFVTPDEAAALFSRPSSHQPSYYRPHRSMTGEPLRVPSVYAGPLIKTTLLQQALSLITDQEALARLEQEIVWTINSAIIAYGEKTQDTQQIADIAKRVRDTISLGLESLLKKETNGGPLSDTEAAARASDLLDLWHVTDLFRHGFAAVQPLQQETQQALRNPAFQAWYDIPEMEQTDEPDDRLQRAFVAALFLRHPLQGGFDLVNGEKVKAFACLADIEAARIRLKQLVDHVSSQS